MQGMVLRETASANIPEVGIQQGDHFYLAFDANKRVFQVVKWERVRWVCSCGKKGCEHRLMVNTFLVEEHQRQSITGDDLVAHLEDDLNQ